MATQEPLNEDVRGTIGRNVRRLRQEAKLTQDAVSEQCGIYRTYLSRIEHGTANPSITVVAALATVLQVCITELFVG